MIPTNGDDVLIGIKMKMYSFEAKWYFQITVTLSTQLLVSKYSSPWGNGGVPGEFLILMYMWEKASFENYQQELNGECFWSVHRLWASLSKHVQVWMMLQGLGRFTQCTFFQMAPYIFFVNKWWLHLNPSPKFSIYISFPSRTSCWVFWHDI